MAVEKKEDSRENILSNLASKVGYRRIRKVDPVPRGREN